MFSVQIVDYNCTLFLLTSYKPHYDVQLFAMPSVLSKIIPSCVIIRVKLTRLCFVWTQIHHIILTHNKCVRLHLWRIVAKNYLMWNFHYMIKTYFSECVNMGDSTPELKKMKLVSDMKAFDDVFPELVQLMTKDGLKDSEVADAMTWYKEVGSCLSLFFQLLYLLQSLVVMVFQFLQLCVVSCKVLMCLFLARLLN